MPNENLPLTWSSLEFEKLIDLVKPHPFLYNGQDLSTRKHILARESTWELIARGLGRPVEECKKRWKALRDGYMKAVKNGNWNKPKVGLFKNLSFLSEPEEGEAQEDEPELEAEPEQENVSKVEPDQQVITDNQEYYEITVVDTPQDQKNNTITFMPKIIMSQTKTDEPPIKIGRKNSGRKKTMPVPVNLHPIKILPKPPKPVNVLNGANLVQILEDPNTKVIQQPQVNQPLRSDVLDSLIEKVLNEQTNPVDVFFRSMAASVKKLPPSLIPKVKMEVCNVIAKYEMQTFDKNASAS